MADRLAESGVVEESRDGANLSKVVVERLLLPGIHPSDYRLWFAGGELREVPDHGVGYGILRYLSEDEATRQSLAALPKAGLSFNYLGQIDPGGDDEEAPMRLAQESAGAGHSHAQHHTHPLSVEGQVAEGRLEMSFSYSENLFHRDSIESLALFFMESLRALIEHCQSPEAGGYTASDFALSELDEEDLEAAFDEVDW